MLPKWLKAKTAPELPDFAALAAAIRGLIAGGKYKTALDQAKDIHKAHGTPASESLLLDAYAARIKSLVEGGLNVEATALANLVRERYPAAADRLATLTADNLARSGKIDELLAPLNDPALSPERLAIIERAIQERVTDPGQIASCPALPAEHPLRQAAGALQRAFAAVTAGPVTDEILALPEVSRRSPLAPWKMLVGALAAMYRRDAQTSRRYLAAIPPGSAPARLIPVIEAIDGDGTPGAPLTAAGNELLSQVQGDADVLKQKAQELDEALDDGYDDGPIVHAVRDLVSECHRTAPFHLEKVKQYAFIRARVEKTDIKRVNAAIGGPPCQDAAFHSMLARRLELDDQPGEAAAAWHDFREKAVEEGWFPAEGPEVAAIYMQIAGLLGKMAHWELKEFNVAIKSKPGIPRDAAALYERAAALDPHPAVFAQWLEWAKKRKGSTAENVAARWRQTRPADIEPLLFLIAAFEKRNAFPTALRYLAEAEQIDSVNPEVRKARLRLTNANFFKQVQQRPVPAVAARTLAAIAEMPHTRQGDRPAFVEALHYILAKGKKDLDEARSRRAEIESLLGSEAAAALLIYVVASACKCDGSEWSHFPNTNRGALPAILARVAALARDLELAVAVPYAWVREAGEQFPKIPHTLAIPQLRELGECARAHHIDEFVYNISAEGLTRGVNTEAEFLLLRAHALLVRSHDRAMMCALTAAGIARRRQELDLAARAVDFLDERFKEEINKLEPAQIDLVLKTEKEETKFPLPGRGPAYPELRGQLCDCPSCRKARGEKVSPLDQEEELEEEDPFDGLPPAFADLFMATMMEGMARNESPAQTMARMEREMGQFLPPARRGKKRR